MTQESCPSINTLYRDWESIINRSRTSQEPLVSVEDAILEKIKTHFNDLAQSYERTHCLAMATLESRTTRGISLAAQRISLNSIGAESLQNHLNPDGQQLLGNNLDEDDYIQLDTLIEIIFKEINSRFRALAGAIDANKESKLDVNNDIELLTLASQLIGESSKAAYLQAESMTTTSSTAIPS